MEAGSRDAGRRFFLRDPWRDGGGLKQKGSRGGDDGPVIELWMYFEGRNGRYF